jgi:hypothetical protein
MPTNPYVPPRAGVEGVETHTQPRYSLRLLLLLLVVAVWCIALPLLWAHNLGQHLGASYGERLSLYKPELVVAGLVILSLALLARRHRLAWSGFAAASVGAPMLTVAFGSPSSGAWPVSSALLAFIAWRVHVLFRPEA